ncbi:MAG: MGMT family protein [candidate division Zixibacteria bacterium]|nr:MGMT family protein [candidate division Zixibacteria bacterium]
MEYRRSENLKDPSLNQRIITLIKNIPEGKVATYGQIATMAGNPQATRLVVWTLNSCSQKEKLPWHRVINSKGRISLKPGQGYELQKMLLQKDGIKFEEDDSIDLEKYLWSPSEIRL